MTSPSPYKYSDNSWGQDILNKMNKVNPINPNKVSSPNNPDDDGPHRLRRVFQQVLVRDLEG